MKIPKQLRVGSHTYEVKQIEELDKCGATNRDNNVISLGANLPPDQKEATLIHEIFHAINNELDHTLLDSLAEQWYSVLKENNLLK